MEAARREGVDPSEQVAARQALAVALGHLARSPVMAQPERSMHR